MSSQERVEIELGRVVQRRRRRRGMFVRVVFAVVGKTRLHHQYRARLCFCCDVVNASAYRRYRRSREDMTWIVVFPKENSQLHKIPFFPLPFSHFLSLSLPPPSLPLSPSPFFFFSLSVPFPFPTFPFPLSLHLLSPKLN